MDDTDTLARHPALDGATVILTPTHRQAPPATEAATRVAVDLAVATGAALCLAGRSHATWADTPHVDRSDLAGLRDLGPRADHLVHAVEAAHRAGVEDVTAVRPSMPDLEGLEAALLSSGADALVVPEALDHVGLVLRLELGRRPLDTLVDRAGPRPVVVVAPDGRTRLAR